MIIIFLVQRQALEVLSLKLPLAVALVGGATDGGRLGEAICSVIGCSVQTSPLNGETPPRQEKVIPPANKRVLPSLMTLKL